MDQYMALSKKDLVIHITMNELYNTHSLILQHIETLVSVWCDGIIPMLMSCISLQMTNNTFAS